MSKLQKAEIQNFLKIDSPYLYPSPPPPPFKLFFSKSCLTKSLEPEDSLSWLLLVIISYIIHIGQQKFSNRGSGDSPPRPPPTQFSPFPQWGEGGGGNSFSVQHPSIPSTKSFQTRHYIWKVVAQRIFRNGYE